jgi:trehalose/maltose transport system substrate-binding protein
MNPAEVNANGSVVRPSRTSLGLAKLRGFAFAVLSVAVSIAALLLFEHLDLRLPTAVFMLLPIAIHSRCGERGPAMVSFVVTLMGMDYFFLEPRNHFVVRGPELPYFIAFTSFAVLVLWFSTVRRRIEADLRRTRAEVEALNHLHFRLPRIGCLILGPICIFFLSVAQGCSKEKQAAPDVVLTIIDQSWVDKESQALLGEELQRFTQETGIRVQVMPAPEVAVDQLETWRNLLESGAKVPDVYGIDVIWPGILADNLVDLKAYVPEQEIAAHFPELIKNDTVKGRLVALPYNLSEGLLFYRVDLLHKYGYTMPPKTWDELEKMAKRIQVGERAKGDKDFWGYVWQGAPSEALTCNGLEWQVSEGGGTILDDSGRPTVNNPYAIRAWGRAAGWVGSISPPGVTAYKEWDAFNIWQAGKAAFMRNWPNAYVAARAENSPNRDRFDVAPLPAGRAGSAATLGGQGYGVSRYSSHPREAAMLVRFLTSRNEQARRCRKSSVPPTIPRLYQDPEILARNPYFSTILRAFREGAAVRPSAAAGKMYPDVSRAYFEAVHAVLSHKKSPSQAAAELENEVTHILEGPARSGNASLDKEDVLARR